LAQSGHANHSQQCPLLGVKRTLVGGAPMSAFDPKPTQSAIPILAAIQPGMASSQELLK